MIIWAVISILSASLYLVLLFFYVDQWLHIPSYNKTNISRKTTVSIIVPARNEGSNILNCLDAVLHQNYPTNLYEVIVIDDFSEDETYKLATSIDAHNLSVFKLAELLPDNERVYAYKKKAIEKAIDQSTADLIISIDADVSMGEKWLRTIVAFYEEKKCLMIAAPVMFYKRNSFINYFQVLDFCGMMLTTGAVIESKNGSMCNGANLAFSRKAFNYVNGFEGVDGFGSGDDIFLMHKIENAFPGTCRFLKSTAAIVYTEAQVGIKQLFSQRLRWASKNKHFKDRKINVQLIVILFANVFLLINLCLLLISCFIPVLVGHALLIIFSIQLFLKLLADFVYLFTGTHFFKRQNLLWWFLPAQFAHLIYISLVGVLGNFKTYHWKGRKYSR